MTTSYDDPSDSANDLALQSILSQWTSGDTYANRTLAIRNGLASGESFAAGVTVQDDADVANGGSSLDWYFGSELQDTIVQRRNEVWDR